MCSEGTFTYSLDSSRVPIRNSANATFKIYMLYLQHISLMDLTDTRY